MRLAVLAAVTVFVLVAGCIGDGEKTEAEPRIILSSLEGTSCASNGDKLTVVTTQGVLIIHGNLTAPTPCHNIDGDFKYDSKTINVSLWNKPVGDGVCIECVGSIPFSSVFQNFNEGLYILLVEYGGETLFNGTVNPLEENQMIQPKNPCGDGVCNPAAGEFGWTCPADCCTSFCGDGVCNTPTRTCVSYNETPENCPKDCVIKTLKIKLDL